MPSTIALVGNPNVGKTTLFNALTGLSHSTGNYPGVTVERKAGTLRVNGSNAELIDLPGTYSLAAQSPDEMIVFDILLNQQRGEHDVDAILAVVDATNIERNLYLVSQLQDLGKPLVVALNMMDVADRRRIKINIEKLGDSLGVPIVPISAHKSVGLDALRDALNQAIHGEVVLNGHGVKFPNELMDEVRRLADDMNAKQSKLGREVPWQEAFRVLIDRGGYAEKRMRERLDPTFEEQLAESRGRVGIQGSLAALETRSRYTWIRDVVARAVQRPQQRIVTRSDKIDRILTHKVWGTLVFVAVMGIVFQAIYAWAAPFMDLIDGTFTSLGDLVASVVPAGPLQSLLVDGVIAGVGSVLVFLPQIVVLSLFIAILEDCGYMARAAFLMDKLFSRVGLSGQSFIPLLSSFACAIPGIMATRTIPNRRDRFATILVAPLMSCSARLPVYVVMIGAFIPNRYVLGGLFGLQGITLFAMYCIGIVVAIPVTWILKKTILRGETPPFLLELPSYKIPQWKTVTRKVWLQGRMFLRRAGTLIFAITVIVWALAYFPRSQQIETHYQAQRQTVAQTMSGTQRDNALRQLNALEQGDQLRNSVLGRLGHVVEPAFRPLGWDWRISMAALASFPAREIIVATMGTIFNLGKDVDESSEGLRNALHEAHWQNGRNLFNIPVALSIMVFFALCCQCGATLAMIRRETGSWRWPLLTFSYMTTLAYFAAFLTYQGGMALGLGG